MRVELAKSRYKFLGLFSLPFLTDTKYLSCIEVAEQDMCCYTMHVQQRLWSALLPTAEIQSENTQMKHCF